MRQIDDENWDAVIREFNKWYFHGPSPRPWTRAKWKGIQVQKSPTDLFRYQMLIWSIKPRLIVELGTLHGGSALYFADTMDAMAIDGMVLTVDLKERPVPNHRKIKYLIGGSTSSEIVDEVTREAKQRQPVIVISDSDHSEKTVGRELSTYARIVSLGSYFVIEDTGNEVWKGEEGNVPRVINSFVRESGGQFVIDKSCEGFGLTSNPGGYLKRVL